MVAGRALAAYLVIAGMLEFVFVLDHTPGRLLVLLTLMLLVFAIDVPLLLGFSVARYAPAGTGGAAWSRGSRIHRPDAVRPPGGQLMAAARGRRDSG